MAVVASDLGVGRLVEAGGGGEGGGQRAVVVRGGGGVAGRGHQGLGVGGVVVVLGGLGAVVLVAGGHGAGGGGAPSRAQRLPLRQLAPQLRHALLFLRRGGGRVRGPISCFFLGFVVAFWGNTKIGLRACM